MKGARSRRVLCYTLILPAVFSVSSLMFLQTCQALTASYGEPYHGYLVNGVVFPNMFPGYHVRDYNRAYTTPELAGALLDAIEAVRTQFPGTCDVFIGDFSKKGGGHFADHVSHQNGRDVDVGLYAKDNRPLHNLVPMNRDNLDPAKTLFFIENLAASQRVQYIFLDRSIQKILYDYGLSHGCSRAYLNRLFGDVPGALVEDIPGHVTHMHVRFFTPWSTLAGHIGADETKMRAIISIAQESYLPKKVDYYVNGRENGVPQLAKSFGVSVGELCEWNHITPFKVLVPGSCLVFYKRNFESGPVHLANSLQPGYIAQVATPPVRVASLEPVSPPPVMSDSVDEQQICNQAPARQASAASHSFRAYKTRRAEERHNARRAVYYTVKYGGTLKDVARKTGVSLAALCRLNRVGKNARLQPGAKIEIAYAVPERVIKDMSRRGLSPSHICFESDSGKTGLTSAYYRVAYGGTLKDVAAKTGIPLSSLCRLNRLSRNAHLRRGQMIKLAQADLPVRPSLGRSSCAVRYPSRKSAASRHAERRRKWLRSARAKVVRKTGAASRFAQRHAAAHRHAEARHQRTTARNHFTKRALRHGHRPLKRVRKQVVHHGTKAKSAVRRRRSRAELARRLVR